MSHQLAVSVCAKPWHGVNRTHRLAGTFSAERLRNTRNGNPRFGVVFLGFDGTCVRGTTAPDSMFAFTMSANKDRAGYVSICSYRILPKGRIVFINIDNVPDTSATAA